MFSHYRAEGGAARQQFGMFVVSPTNGTVIVGGSITINVDCITEQEGRGDEVSLSIHFLLYSVDRLLSPLQV